MVAASREPDETALRRDQPVSDRRFRLDADGTFAIDGLPPGDYELRARSGTATSGLQELTVEAGTVHFVELELAAGDAVELELHFPPLPGVEETVVATIRSRAGKVYRQGALPYGRVDSEFVPMTLSLPAGAYEVVATVGDDEALLRGEFEVDPSEQAPVRVMLQ